MTAPSYGAGNPNEHDYPPPVGAVYVDPRRGDDLNSGALSRPLRHLSRAITVTPSGGTIVLRGDITGGSWVDYPESVMQLWRKPVTIQGAPGEAARLIGSDVRTDWTFDSTSGLWWTPAPGFDHTPAGDGLLDPARPWACWPEQVWIDDQPLTMVGLGMFPVADEFKVWDGRLWIGTDPTGSVVRVAVRSTAIAGALDMGTGNHPALNLYALGVYHYGTQSLDRAAVKVYGVGNQVERLWLVENSAAGLSCMRGASQQVRHCSMLRNGQLGGHGYLTDGLEVASCLIDGNNRKGFASIGQAGAWKIAETVGARFHHNQVTGNRGHGLWADVASDHCEFTWNTGHGNTTLIFDELSQHGRIHGNHATGCTVGILVSGSQHVQVTHNTCTGNDTDIRTQTDRRRADWPLTTHTVTANITTAGADPAEPPSPTTVSILGLPEDEGTRARSGWYGPNYIPPQEPEEPMPFDPGPLRDEVEVAVDTISLLEEQLAAAPSAEEVEALTAEIVKLKADNASLAKHLMAAAQQVNAHNVTIATLNETAGTLNEVVADLTSQRDQAVADQVTTRGLLGRAEARLVELDDLVALQAATITEQAEAIAAAEAAMAGASARIIDLELERDELRTDVDNAEARIVQLEAELAECQPDPPAPARLIVGGSNKHGFPDLADRLSVVPGSFTLFCSGTRLSTTDVARIVEVADAGALCSLSVAMPGPGDTVHNIEALVAAGLEETRIGYTIAHEPTQKGIDPSAYRLAYEHAAEVLPEAWSLVPVFQRADYIADPSSDRHPSHWLPAADLVDALGVDAYDKNLSVGRSFEWLMTQPDPTAPEGSVSGPPLQFLADYNQGRDPDGPAGPLRFWVRETSCPEHPDYGRPAGWKPAWFRDLYAYASANLDLFELVNVFNSDVGPDTPLQGWWAWTSSESMAAYVEIVRAQFASDPVLSAA